MGYISKENIGRLQRNEDGVEMKRITYKENNYVIRIVGSPYKYNNLEGEGELMATIYFLMPGNTQREICTVYAGAHRYGTYARKLEVNWSAWGVQVKNN